MKMNRLRVGFRYREIHICWSKAMFGPDTSSSLDLNQLQDFAQDKMNILKVETDKDSISDSMLSMKSFLKEALSQVVHFKRRSNNGYHCLQKTCGGLPLKFKDKIIGKTLKVKMNKDDPFNDSVMKILAFIANRDLRSSLYYEISKMTKIWANYLLYSQLLRKNTATLSSLFLMMGLKLNTANPSKLVLKA